LYNLSANIPRRERRLEGDLAKMAALAGRDTRLAKRESTARADD
jgi:hypothetical protein